MNHQFDEREKVLNQSIYMFDQYHGLDTCLKDWHS